MNTIFFKEFMSTFSTNKGGVSSFPPSINTNQVQEVKLGLHNIKKTIVLSAREIMVLLQWTDPLIPEQSAQ